MSTQLPQLESFLLLIEYLGENPAGPYRAAALARSLTALHQQPFAPARVWRWLQLLERRGFILRHKCDLFLTDKFVQWSTKYQTRNFI